MFNSQVAYQFAVDPHQPLPAPGGSNFVTLNSSSELDPDYSDSIGKESLEIALIGPDEQRRLAASEALAGCRGNFVREFTCYPPSLDDVPRLLEQNHDVIIIDLDTDQEYALELIESICASGTATVMVYSDSTDSKLLVRCMRAGAREFLTLPMSQTAVAEALVRASARRSVVQPVKKTNGKLLVFVGAKGGAGVTTIACNYAVALAKESSQRTLLIDLDLPLGDVALNLGVAAEYSTVDALRDFNRLDSSLLAKLAVEHSSGLSILAAPGKFPQFPASSEAIDKLIAVARRDFKNVVVDLGSRLDLTETALFKDASTVYLVTQATISQLRNSNRLISHLFSAGGPKLEIVVNRYESRSALIDDEQITKALTRPVDWKVPNDHTAVRKMQNTATPFALGDSPISRQIKQMARSVNPEITVPEKKKGFRLFG